MTTARNLIIDSYYLSGITSKKLMTVSGQQIKDGLNMLNRILAVKSIDSRLIPYHKEYVTTAVSGQQIYFIPGLIETDTATFYIDPVSANIRYPINLIPRDKYYGSFKVENISTLPYSGHIERTVGGSNLYLYPLPNAAYTLKIWGLFALTQITEAMLDVALETYFDLFYLEYLNYALAKRICDSQRITFNPEAKEELLKLENILLDVGAVDLSFQKVAMVGDGASSAVNWPFINLNKGWMP